MLKLYLLVGDPFASPGVGGVQGAVAALYDGRVRILADRRVFEREEVVPCLAVVVADSDGEWCAGTFGLAHEGLEVVVDEELGR